MSARDDILKLIHRYTFLIDQGDLDGFASLFEHGEWGSEGSQLLSGKQQMLDMLNNMIIIYPDGTPRTRHVVTIIDLEIDEAKGVAKSQSYITLYQQTDDFPLQVVLCGIYNDEFFRKDAQWRFAKRTIKNVLYGDTSAHIKASL